MHRCRCGRVDGIERFDRDIPHDLSQLGFLHFGFACQPYRRTQPPQLPVDCCPGLYHTVLLASLVRIEQRPTEIIRVGVMRPSQQSRPERRRRNPSVDEAVDIDVPGQDPSDDLPDRFLSAEQFLALCGPELWAMVPVSALLLRQLDADHYSTPASSSTGRPATSRRCWSSASSGMIAPEVTAFETKPINWSRFGVRAEE